MSVASVLSVTCALIIVGMLLAIAINVNYITSQMEENLVINVYLNDSLASAQKNEIERDLRGYGGVERVEFISKVQALKNAREFYKETPAYLEGYTEDSHPFPESFVVHMTSTDMIKQVRDFAGKLSGVREATYGEKNVDALLKFNEFTNIVSWVVVFILSVIAVFIIYNTIKLTVFSRKNDITIMKFMGATNWYIRVPFIIEGSTLGLLGACVSILLIRNLYYYLMGYLQSSLSVLPMGSSLAPAGWVMLQISISFVIYGILLGALGSVFSMKRFLRV